MVLFLKGGRMIYTLPVIDEAPAGQKNQAFVLGRVPASTLKPMIA